MKLIVFSCSHYKETAPAKRKEGYGAQILKKIDLLQEIARKANGTIICLGDLFDKKFGTTMKEANRMMSLIDSSLEWYTILGNHDIQAYNQRLETQPMGLLEEAKKVKLLESGVPVELEKGVFLTGESYHTQYEVAETYNTEISDPECRYHIHCTHGMVTKKNMPFNTISCEDVLSAINCDILLNGHSHEPFEYGDRIYNVGSMARIAKDKNFQNKTPKALYIDTKKKDVKWIDIPVEEDIWKDDELERDTMNTDALDEFVKEMKEMEIADENIIEELLKDKSDKVKEKFYTYIDK